MNFIASSGQLRASFLRWALFCVPAVMLLGFLGGQVGTPQTYWFESLLKPAIYPEPWIFGAVWAVMYVLIGLSVALIASAWGARGRGLAIGLFIIHFALNISWTGVFFAGESIMNGLYLLIVIVVTLLIVMIAFWRVRKSAVLLLLPYLGWVCFATYLNYQFHLMNPNDGKTILQEPAQRYEI
jgi:tryptophan-rich sensory protein